MKSILLFSIILFTLSFRAQNNNVIDSLKLQLEASSDTVHFHALKALSNEYSQTDMDLSMNYAVQCLAYAKETDMEEWITTATMLVGNCYTRQGEYETSITYYIDASEMASQAKDTFLLSQSYSNIGAIQFYIENFDKAIEYFKKSQQIIEAIGTPKQIAQGLSNIGEAFRNIEQLDSAIIYLNRSYSIFKEIKHTNGLATSLNNIGNIYAQQKDYYKAIDYYERSLVHKYIMNKPRDLAVACNNLGEMYFILKNSKSLNYYHSSEEYALKSQSLIDIKIAYKGLSKLYEQKKNWGKSLDYFKQYSALSDSLINVEKANAVANFEIKYQTIEKEKEIVKLEAEKEKERLYSIQKELEVEKIQKENEFKTIVIFWTSIVIISSIIVLLLLAVVVLIIMKRNKERKNDNAILTTKNHEIETKNRDIMDSIKYAKRIQNAILPPNKIVKEFLHDSFIYYKPKDIVAGDFYWLEHKEGKVLFAAADCTGHGVPGAMVSVVCSNGLNRSVREHGITDPGKILDKTRDIIIQEFEKSEEDVNDGMDIALCSLEGNTLLYAGAHNPLWIIRNGKLLETKANKQPIGKFDKLLPYTTHTFELEPNDTFYIFSDGYVDQFGGEKGKKFKANAFKELLISIQDKSMEEQKEKLDQVFESWKGDLEQIDDVCVIGIRM
jgi:serine phosphatase RsbU (regulator of sigma subunit)/TPR repeat protein